MDFCIGLAEISNHIFFKLIIIFVADGDEVVTLLCKLAAQVDAMLYASAEHDGLARAAKDFMSLFNPLLNNVSSNDDPALGSFGL